MELIRYEGLPVLPRRFWKRVYTPSELEEKRIYRANRAAKKRAEAPAAPPKLRKSDAQVRSKALADAAWNSAGHAVPDCYGKSERQSIERLYLSAVEMTEKSGIRYSVDHIYPLMGSKYGVCGLHVVANLAVIPLTENMAKNNRPHASWEHYANH